MRVLQYFEAKKDTIETEQIVGDLVKMVGHDYEAQIDMLLQKMAEDFQKEFAKKNEEAFRPIVETLRNLVREVARRRNLDMVFETTINNVTVAPGSTLVYAVDQTDITEELVKLYDERNP